MSLLLDRGANTNLFDANYGAVLALAVSKGNKDIVSLLLDQGADMNEVGAKHGTALTLAVSRGKRALCHCC